MKKINVFIGKNITNIIFVVFLLAGLSVEGQIIQVSNPEDVGISSERLNRIDKVMNESVATGKIPGVVTMIARHGKVAYCKAFGMMDIENKKEMTQDAIFRIASMSKSITSVAVMMLYEEGYFLLSDPISKYIPEFKNAKVLVKSSLPDRDSLIPANSEITIRQLLNHTSGITYGGGMQRKYYEQAGVTVGLTPTQGTIGEMIKNLGKLPLISQPGAEFHYGMSVDVLGYLIESVTKQPLDEFFKHRIFEPLKMHDTYFNLPKNKLDRLVSLYKIDGNQKLVKATGFVDFAVPQTYLSGGAGLVSTTSDYLNFAQMLLNKGELDGKRLLSRKTIELMTTNSIGEELISSLKHYRIIADKFGLGFGIRTERGVYDEAESLGSYGWDGAFYTKYWVDPKEDLIGIFMSQVDSYGSENLINKFKVLAYQAIAD